MGGADHGPFGPNLIETAQQELAEASGLLDLSEDGLDHLFAQTVSAVPPFASKGFGHLAHQGRLRELASSSGVRSVRAPSRIILRQAPRDYLRADRAAIKVNDK